MNVPELSVVILNYKNFNDTINCIKSVLDYNIQVSYRIIVVDNNSNNDSLQSIYSHFKDVIVTTFWESNSRKDSKLILVQNHLNTGYAAGNNIGLKIGYELGSKYLMVLNNDILFINNAVDSLIEELNNLKDALCIGPILLKGNGSYDYNCAKRRPRYSDFFILSYFGRWLKTPKWNRDYYYLKGKSVTDKTIPIDIISGSCMLFKTEVFYNVGFFDEATFLYYEEAILCEKGLRGGLSMYLSEKNRVIHLGAQSTSSSNSSSFTVECEYKSALHYLVKYRSLSMFTAKTLCFPMKLFLKMYQYKISVQNK